MDKQIHPKFLHLLGTNTEETWVPLKGFNYGYELSTQNRVRSIRSGKILKIYKGGFRPARIIRSPDGNHITLMRYISDRVRLKRYGTGNKLYYQMITLAFLRSMNDE